MPIPEPRTAPEASRLIRCTEAAARMDPLDVWLYPTGQAMRLELESFKTDEYTGERTSRRYVVDLVKSTCTCPDFRKHGMFCKHLLYTEAVFKRAAALDALAKRAEEEEDGRLFMQNLHTERSLLAC